MNSNFEIAIDSGVIEVGAKLSTVNQVKFDLHSEETSEKLAKEHLQMQSFMLKVYDALLALLQR